MVTSPRQAFRGLRTVPLEWDDDRMLLISQAIKQLQEIAVHHPLEVVEVTADYTVLDIDILILADASSADLTVTLPTAQGREGRLVEILKTDSTGNLVTIDPKDSETINGASSISLTQENAMRGMRSDGMNWRLVEAIGNATGL